MWLLAFLFCCNSVHANLSTSFSIDLDGRWNFKADPLDVGEKEQWFNADLLLGASLNAPGAWQAQGIGNATDLMTHQFQGVGWYRRTVHVDAKQLYDDTRLFLWIGGHPGGVVRSAVVYANGKKVGRHVGYVKPLEVEIPRHLLDTDNELTLAVAVDSRWNTTEEVLWSSGNYWQTPGDGFTMGGYGGIVGHSKLLLRRSVWVHDSVQVTTVPLTSSVHGDWRCEFRIQLGGPADGQAVAAVEISEWMADKTSPVLARSVSQSVAAGSRHVLKATIPNPKLWYPGRPSPLYIATIRLYKETASASGGMDVIDVHKVRFGVRDIELNESWILCNGERIYLRGYGDDGFYIFSMAPPMNKSFYKAQLQLMQPLGYNFVRLHTHALPTEFMDAADEMGFLVNPEFSMGYAYGCNQAVSACVEQHAPPTATPIQKSVWNESFVSQVQRLSHHPSVFGWVISNELNFDRVGAQYIELYRFAKDFDPGRPCWYSDGAFDLSADAASLSCKNGIDPNNKLCFVDVLVMQSGWAHTPQTPGTGFGTALPVPSLIHEAVDARTFPRLSQQLSLHSKSLFHPAAQLWYRKPLEDMTRLGLHQENEMWAMASEWTYTMTMKAYLENFYLDPATSGYEWWVGWDWPGATNGIFGGDAEMPLPKLGIDKTILKSLQSEVTVLINNPVAVQNKAYQVGASVSLDMLVYNLTLGGTPWWGAAAGELTWEAGLKGTSIRKGSILLPAGSVQQGNMKTAGSASFVMPEVESPVTVDLKVALKVGSDIVARNHWPLGLFPAPSAAKACPVPMYATSVELLPAVKQICSDAELLPPEPFPSSLGSWPFVVVVDPRYGTSSQLVATTDRAGGIFAMLNPTECVTDHGIAKPVAIKFTQSWWMAPGSTGTLVYNHTERLGMFGGFLDYRWMDLVDNALAYSLDEINASSPKVHIRSIPTAGHNEWKGLPKEVYLSDVRNLALLWEARLPNGDYGPEERRGAGRFVVSGLSLLDSTGKLKASMQAAAVFREFILYAVDLAQANVSGRAIERIKYV